MDVCSRRDPGWRQLLSRVASSSEMLQAQTCRRFLLTGGGCGVDCGGELWGCTVGVDCSGGGWGKEGEPSRWDVSLLPPCFCLPPQTNLSTWGGRLEVWGIARISLSPRARSVISARDWQTYELVSTGEAGRAEGVQCTLRSVRLT